MLLKKNGSCWEIDIATYVYGCECGTEFERVMSMRDHQNTATCECGKIANQVLTVPKLAWASREVNYDCPITGAPITSWQQHRNNLALHGCQQSDPGMKQDAERFRKREQDKLERAVDETVEREVEAMPSRKKEMLERELTAGMDVEITRQSV